MSRRLLERIAVSFVLAAVLLMAVENWRWLTKHESRWQMIGKVVARQPPNELTSHLKLIQSEELRIRAEVRVRALHPELKANQVKIAVMKPMTDSRVLTVTAVGNERLYLRIFLDAILDEYVALRREKYGAAY